MAGNIIDHKATLCITIHFLSFYLQKKLERDKKKGNVL